MNQTDPTNTVYHADQSATLHHGNALRLSQFIEPESVDLIITSPPYFALRSYKDGDEHYDNQIGDEDSPQQFLAALWAVTEQCQRILKPGGSLFVNLGDKYSRGSRPRNQPDQFRTTEKITYEDPKYVNDKRTEKSEVLPKSLMGLPWRYAIGCTDGMAGKRWVLRSEIIWSKPNGLPESVKDRVRRSHETWFHFTRDARYFSSIDEIREEYSPASLETYRRGGLQKNTDRSPGGTRHRNDGDPNGWTGNSLGKLPGSVWTVPLEPLRVPEWLGVEHFAAFPQEWPRRIILGWSPLDGVVLDPFCGTGTVPMVARALGRHGIGVDLSRDYLKLAQWRIWESGHASKSIARTNKESQGRLGL